MPGCGIHLILASRVPAAAPGPADRAARSAFLAGAVAPDMGYCPGGDRFTSDLAHYVRSGELARSLLGSADGPAAAAFARGWATHVLADALIHPLINRAAGELVGGHSAGPLTFADDPAAHIRVEQGLDAVIAARFGASALWPGGHRSFIAPAVRVLGRAYAGTYGVTPPDRALAASCRALARSVPLLMGYGRAVGRWFAGADGVGAAAGVVFRTAGAATALLPRSPVGAFARPAPPPDWLVGEILAMIDAFPARFAAVEARGLADLPDYNLDTGETGDAAAAYELAVGTREALARRGGSV
jgi:hypothetical protein